jgi:hypothetical protein
MNKPLLALTAAALACTGAAAQSNASRPYYVGLTQDFTHQSNVRSAPSGAETSDTISTTTLRGGVKALFGRQRAFANLSVFHTRYADLDGLDSTGYGADLGLDWATVERLSGTLVARSNRRQADFNSGLSTATLKNTERSDEFNATVRLGGDGLLAFDGGLGYRRVTFSAPEFAARQYRRNDGSLGLTYRPSGALTLGAGVAAAKTDFLEPDIGQTTADSNKRRDLYLTANWLATGASTLSARVNLGKTEYDQATAADYSGATGSLSWLWKPSGRLQLNTTLARDTGQDAGFRRAPDGSGTPTATDFSRVTDTLGVTAVYDLTGKIVLTADVSTARRDLVNVLSAASGKDTTNRVSLGAKWAAMRNVAVGCQVGREQRSGDSTDYTNDRFGCYVQATLD